MAIPNESFDERSLSLAERIDRICETFEAAIRGGSQPIIEDYLVADDSDEKEQLFRQLLRLDLEYKNRSNAVLSINSYLEKFSLYRDIVDQEILRISVPSTSKSWDTGTVDSIDVCSQPLLQGKDLGRFKSLELLGQGSFGTVYKAYDEQFDRWVALKLAHSAFSFTAEDIRTYFREARAAGQLHHPNIVPVFEPGNVDGHVFIVSAFIPGETLEEEIKRGRKFTPEVAVTIIEKIAQALHYAHVNGVIHRDLKPANIMMTPDGEPMLMDFGLARRLNSGDTRTQPGMLLGTPAYMSPEQAEFRSHEADSRSDLWSLAVVLFELLIGRRPFQGESSQETLELVRTCQRITPSDFDAPISRDLDAVIQRCLVKNPIERLTSCQELADELHSWLNGLGVKSRRVGIAEKTLRTIRNNPLPSALLLALFVTLSIGVMVSSYYATDASSKLNMAQKESRHAFEANVKQQRELAKLILSSGDPEFPSLVEQLKDSSETAKPFLRERFDNPKSETEKLRAACALSLLGEPKYDYIISRVGNEIALRSPVILETLREAPPRVIARLNGTAQNENLPVEQKARFSTALFRIGNPQCALNLLHDRKNPIPRTVFIVEFGEWLDPQLCDSRVMTGLNIPYFDSCVYLALGSLSTSKMDQKVVLDWENHLVDRLNKTRDVLIYVSAEWALKKWKSDKADQETGGNAVGERDWYRNSLGMLLAKLPTNKGEYLEEEWYLESMPYFATTEVTVEQFEQFAAASSENAGNPRWKRSLKSESVSPASSHPAQCLTWLDAVRFCNWLSLQEGLRPCYRILDSDSEQTPSVACDFELNGYRLPTSREWSIACRSGTKTEYHCGDDISKLKHFEVFRRFNEDTMPVASLFPNTFGIFDMHGNVSEWCWDTDPDSIEPKQKIPLGEAHLVRGGNWHSLPSECKSDQSRSVASSALSEQIGFRVVRLRAP